LDAVETLLGGGIDHVIIGTALLKTPEWVKKALEKFHGRMMAGIDARGGEVAVEGWKEGSGQCVEEVVKTVEGLGFSEIIFTDIGKDGTLSGPNVDATRAVLEATSLGVYASGGVSCLNDIKVLKTLDGLRGCIVGKALYDGRLSYREATVC
jgi:phosphoribosylformimino-5-aminoimidazole carboxamide ribotide isomerase